MYDLSALFSGLGAGNSGNMLSSLSSLFGGSQTPGAFQPAGTQNAIPSSFFRAYPGAPLGPYAIPQGMPPPNMNQLTAAPTGMPQSGAVQPPLKESATPSLSQGGYQRGGSTTYYRPVQAPDAASMLQALLGMSGGGMDPATQAALQHALMLHQMLMSGQY